MASTADLEFFFCVHTYILLRRHLSLIARLNKLHLYIRPNVRQHVRPAKIQISLRIRAVCSETFLGKFWIAKSTTQLAFFINLQRAVIGPSATLTGR